MKPKLLDLYCGAGGAAKGYVDAGFDVTGVDLFPQPNYAGHMLIQSDALDFLRKYGHYFDVIHGSPPCQGYTTLAKGNNGNEDDYPKLIDATRLMLEMTGKPYIIENVVSAPLRQDLVLCGLMFDLKVFRHRIFEIGGWKVEQPKHPSHKGHRVSGWRHGVKYEGDMVAVYGNGGGKGSVSDWQDAMGIHWTSKKKELAEAIPPAYTEFIGKQLMTYLTENKEK